MKILSSSFDSVINSIFLVAESDYEFSGENLIPLIGKLEMQRELQNQKFYDRLARDIENGCIMPPLTIAIIDQVENLKDKKPTEYKSYITSNLRNFFILDGMQRLNTLNRVIKSGVKFNKKTPVYLNILICSSIDHLLYRMITLNNGQKPMTARHQIEVIASNVYDFDNSGLTIQAEKRKAGEKRKRGAFKKADLIKAYLAFLSSSINIDNDKIVQDKMDELIASKIMDSEITTSEVKFDDIIDTIEKLTANEFNKKWFLNQNNLIGFCAGAKKSIQYINNTDADNFAETIQNFEDAFDGFDVSKIKLGSVRRKAVLLLAEKYKKFEAMSSNEILDEISMEI